MATLQAELAGLDALELAVPKKRSVASRVWAGTWPKLGAVALAIGIWQIVVWSGWREEFVLPSPFTVLDRLFSAPGTFVDTAWVTLRTGAQGFAIALVIGTITGALVARIRVLRAAFGSMITGLMTMPSIAWFPAAIVLFKLSNGAILFVVVIGAFPSIANGLIAGIDNTPPVLMRASRVLGAKGLTAFRHVVLPAALPTYVSGLKQGWAFAWRSLLAGELLVTIPGGALSLGRQLDTARQLPDYPEMYATMIAILIVGVLVDSLVFGRIERRIRRQYGLVDAAEN
jgi:NitT/TauT family transport system permease protein